MVPIKQNLVSTDKYNIKCPYSMDPEGITVHNTANKASAANEIAYMTRNDNEVSYHYAIDDIEIIQGVPEDRNAFHAGDGNGNGNRKTIGIEICYSTGDKAKFEKAQENAAEFVAYKLKEKGWGTDRVYPHKHWSGKHCPHRTLNEYGWDYFIGLVNKYLKGDSNIITKSTTSDIDITYQTWDDVKNKWLPNVTNDSDYAGILGNNVCAVYANLAEGDCVYKVHIESENRWLPEVKNRTDYAGKFNVPIDGFMIKSTDPNIKIYYQVHIKGGKWLEVVSGYNTGDNKYGYAGILGKTIDGIRMYAKKTVVETVTAPQRIPTPTTTSPVVEYFRVRTSWSDVKSQKGAYSLLENAIQKCREVGEGYNVYDEDGNKVYSYTPPSTVESTQTAVKPEITPVEPEVNIEIKPEIIPAPEINMKTNSGIEGNLEPNINIEEKVEIDENKINTIVVAIIRVLKKLAEIFLNKFKNKGE